jgi:putative endonuclease
MPHMYVLRCADGTTYVGSTWDLERRLSEHQLGVGGEYTSKRLPVELAYAEEFARVDDAYAREKQVQNWSRAKRAALIAGDVVSLSDAAKKRFS